MIKKIIKKDSLFYIQIYRYKIINFYGYKIIKFQDTNSYNIIKDTSDFIDKFSNDNIWNIYFLLRWIEKANLKIEFSKTIMNKTKQLIFDLSILETRDNQNFLNRVFSNIYNHKYILKKKIYNFNQIEILLQEIFNLLTK